MARKKTVHIDSGGGPIFLDKVDNRQGKISGRSDRYTEGLNASEVAKLFDYLSRLIERHPRLSKDEKTDIEKDVQEIREELAKKDKANESFILRRLRNIGRMAPDILDVTLATITNPIAGFGIIAKKIAAKAKEAAA